MTHDDEFYIGYEPVLPPGVARRLRVLVSAAALIMLALAVLLTTVQRPLAASHFDYGGRQAWTGRLVRTPAPALLAFGSGMVGAGACGALGRAAREEATTARAKWRRDFRGAVEVAGGDVVWTEGRRPR